MKDKLLNISKEIGDQINELIDTELNGKTYIGAIRYLNEQRLAVSPSNEYVIDLVLKELDHRMKSQMIDKKTQSQVVNVSVNLDNDDLDEQVERVTKNIAYKLKVKYL